ncbi:hypothetical protein ABT274_43135, partial [Streptomyces sp. NPDC001127]
MRLRHGYPHPERSRADRFRRQIPESPEKFTTAISTWEEWQDAPWSRLRYAIAEANLVRRLDGLPDEPLCVVDLVGGDGGDAARLAARGHHVTIIDYVPAVPAEAAQRADADGLAERFTRCLRGCPGLRAGEESDSCGAGQEQLDRRLGDPAATPWQ